MTVSQLHRATGISRTVLQGYELGKFAPGAWEMKRLCDVLRVSPNRLLFGTEKPFGGNTHLQRLVGDVSKVENASKLTLVIQTLRAEEIEAFMKLLESIAITRLGSPEKYEALIKTVGLIYGDGAAPGMLEDIGKVIEQNMTPEMQAQLEAAAKPFSDVEDETAGTKRRRKSKSG